MCRGGTTKRNIPVILALLLSVSPACSPKAVSGADPLATGQLSRGSSTFSHSDLLQACASLADAGKMSGPCPRLASLNALATDVRTMTFEEFIKLRQGGVAAPPWLASLYRIVRSKLQSPHSSRVARSDVDTLVAYSHSEDHSNAEAALALAASLGKHQQPSSTAHSSDRLDEVQVAIHVPVLVATLLIMLGCLNSAAGYLNPHYEVKTFLNCSAGLVTYVLGMLLDRPGP